MVTARQNSPTPDERDLLRVRRAQAGDPAAFDELIEAHRELLERVVRHFVRNGDDAEDVTQEAWMRAATKIRDLREPSRFRPWLRTIARNSCMTYLKREKGHRAVGTLDDEDAPQIADAETETPEAHLLSSDEQRKVWESLGALSERDRTALFYREYQGMAYAEIAERLGISRNAAEVCVFRARERFRRVYYEVERDEHRCEFSGLQLSMYMDGDLDDITHRRIMKHVDTCGGCAQRIASLDAGRSIYRQMAGLVIMPGASGGIVASLQAAIATILGWIGGGPGAAGGATAGAIGASAVTGGTIAGTGAAATTAAAAVGGASAGVSIPSVFAGQVAASAILGVLLLQGGSPAPTIEEGGPPAQPAAAAALAAPAGSESVTELESTVDEPALAVNDTVVTTPLGAPFAPLVAVLNDLSAPDAEPVLDADVDVPEATPPGPPPHAAVHESSPPRATPGAAAAQPEASNAAGGNPPAHAAAHGQQDADRGGPPSQASAKGTQDDRSGGPPSHASSEETQADRGGGRPEHAQGGGPPAHAQADGIVREVHAATIEGDEDRPGRAPEHASAGGNGNGYGSGYGHAHGHGNGSGNGNGNGRGQRS